MLPCSNLGSMSSLTFGAWAFTFKERREVADRHTRKAKREYIVLECPYCDDEVLVAADNYTSNRPRRVHEHLCVCDHYHWTVPKCSRSRQLTANKPIGREVNTYTQLNLGAGLKLERHPLGSLLPGRPRPYQPPTPPLWNLSR